jgi:repressor LexA
MYAEEEQRSHRHGGPGREVTYSWDGRLVSGMLLTKRQKQVLDFVTAFIKENRYSPSLEEIAEELDLVSVSTVHKHVSGLMEKGLLRRGWNQNRSLEPVKQEHRPRAAEIPLAGTLVAGRPVDLFEEPGSLKVPESFLGRGETFALQVKGDTLMEEGIRDGDYVIVERHGKARNGQTAVALIDGRKATVKTVFLGGGQVRLVPAGTSRKPLVLPAGRVRIIGGVLSVLRHYRRQP